MFARNMKGARRREVVREGQARQRQLWLWLVTAAAQVTTARAWLGSERGHKEDAHLPIVTSGPAGAEGGRLRGCLCVCACEVGRRAQQLRAQGRQAGRQAVSVWERGTRMGLACCVSSAATQCRCLLGRLGAAGCWSWSFGRRGAGDSEWAQTGQGRAGQRAGRY